MSEDAQIEAQKRAYAEDHRAALRVMPYILAILAVSFVGIRDGLSATNLLWVCGFHVGIEIIYLALDRDSLLLSVGVVAAWCWAIYNWLYLEQGIFTSFMLPLAVIYAVARVPIFIKSYADIRKGT